MSLGSSPFAVHLSTNYVPSEDEVPLIKLIIKDRKAKAAALATKIEELELELQAVRERQAAYLKDMEDHQVLLHPVRRIPFDIMSSIFQALQEPSPQAIASTLHPSTVVSRVCREWRSYAVNSPSLWSAMDIAIPFYGRQDFKKVGGPSTLAQRITGLTHAAEAWSSEADIPPTESHYRLLVETIVACSPRWRKANIRFEFTPHNHRILELLLRSPTSLGSLQDVTLDLRSSYRNPVAVTSTSLPGVTAAFLSLATHSLRALSLSGGVGGAPFSGICSNLTKLEYCPTDAPTRVSPTIRAEQLLQMLRAFPVVVDVTFYNLGSGRCTPLRVLPEPVSLAHLTVFRLRGAHCPTGFAQSLDLPALHELQIDFRPDREPSSVHCGLVQCAQHFGPRLRSLTFAPDLVDRAALATIFDALLSLETLALKPHGQKSFFYPDSRSASNPGVDYYAIMELNGEGNTEGGRPRPLRCPRLAKLTLSTSNEHYWDDAIEQALLRLILDRTADSGMSGGSTLKEVTVVWSDPLKDDADLVDELRNRGVDMDKFNYLSTCRMNPDYY